MTDVETVLRTELHDTLDTVEPSTLTAQRALRSGQRARRRRTAVVAAVASVALVTTGITAASLIGSGAVKDESVTASSDVSSRAVDYAEQFRDGDFAGVRADMTARTRASLSEASLRSLWEQVVADRGGLTGTGQPSVTTTDYTTVLVPLRFAHGAVDMRVAFDRHGSVIGLTLLNAGLADLPPDAADFEARARQVVGALAAGHYADVYAQFDATMQRGLPVPKLERDWRAVSDTMHGGFVSTGGATTRQVSANTVVDVFCTMRSGELKVRVSFGSGGRISGLYFLEP